jgi:hypothetical protein
MAAKELRVPAHRGGRIDAKRYSITVCGFRVAGENGLALPLRCRWGWALPEAVESALLLGMSRIGPASGIPCGMCIDTNSMSGRLVYGNSG